MSRDIIILIDRKFGMRMNQSYEYDNKMKGYTELTSLQESLYIEGYLPPRYPVPSVLGPVNFYARKSRYLFPAEILTSIHIWGADGSSIEFMFNSDNIYDEEDAYFDYMEDREDWL